MWVFAPFGALLVVDSRRRVVCHACGDALTALSAQHVRRHGLTLVEYRERFGLNRKTSLVSPVLAEKRRGEGQRRWAENGGVRDGLAVGQAMARSGAPLRARGGSTAGGCLSRTGSIGCVAGGCGAGSASGPGAAVGGSAGTLGGSCSGARVRRVRRLPHRSAAGGRHRPPGSQRTRVRRD